MARQLTVGNQGRNHQVGAYQGSFRGRERIAYQDLPSIHEIEQTLEQLTAGITLRTEDIPQLSSRPFPVSGIRLSQLKDDIKELCANGVLSPGDSPYTSPMFYVLKKASDGKTAAKGRLCFDYRKINAMIKTKKKLNFYSFHNYNF